MSNDEDRASHIGTPRRKRAKKFSHRLLLCNEKVRVIAAAKKHALQLGLRQNSRVHVCVLRMIV